MGVLDSFTVPAGGATDALPKADAPIPSTGFFTNLKAGYSGAFAGGSETNLHQNLYERPYYDQIVAALNAAGERTTDPLNGGGASSPREYRNPLSGSVPLVASNNPLAWGQREADSLFQAVRRRQAANPNFLKDLSTPDLIRARAQSDRQRDLMASEAVNANASTLGELGYLIGGIAAAPFEPSSYVGGAAGGGAAKTIGRQILKTALTEGAVNAAAAVGTSPFQAADIKANLGRDMTATDVLTSAVEQGAFGAVLGTAHIAAPHVIARGGKAAADAFDAVTSRLPEPVRNATMAAAMRAGTVQDRALTLWARDGLGVGTDHDISTPDERAAIHSVDRDADVREANPFPSGAPDPIHENRLTAVMRALDLPDAPPTIPTPAPLPAAPASSVVDRIIQRESGGNPNAHAGTSSASGLGQFTDATWLGVVRKAGLASGSDAELLARKNDPVLGRAATEAYVAQNAAGLRKAGFEDSAGNIYLAHFLGEGGAKSVLRADPNTPIERIVGETVVAANEKILRGKTAGDTIEWAHKRMGDATGQPVGQPHAIGGVDPEDIVPDGMPDIEVASFRPEELLSEAKEAPIARFRRVAEDVADRLPPVEEGAVRLWRGNRPGEVGLNPQFTNDLAGIALPFREGYGGDLSFIDVPTPVADASLRDGAVAPGAEFVVPADQAARAQVVDHLPSWDESKAGLLTVWEASDGRRVIVDGNKRVERAIGAGAAEVQAHVLREANGITLDQAREIGRLKNEADMEPLNIAMREAADFANAQFGGLLNGPNGGSEIPRTGRRPIGAAEADGLVADGRGLPGGPTAFDDAASAREASLEFGQPGSEAETRQIDSLQHDLTMGSQDGVYRLSEEAPERTFAQILKESDADLDAVEKARACMAPPKVEEA